MANIELASARQKAAAGGIGYQRWSDLLFLHWRLKPDCVAPLLPPEVELDLWDGDAWVGLVPFHMSGVRPWWFVATPGLSEFHEANVRTYVIHNGRPGVWFFSLEASNWPAVQVARRRWHLNYHHARMELSRAGERIAYRSRRTPIATPPIGMQASVRLASQPSAAALPGTLEHFLIERYFLFCRTPRGALLSGEVHHRPYQFAPAEVEHLEENLLAAAGVATDAGPCHAVYSCGVSVAISPLARVR